ncbi:MAG: regulatory signaling modulator protein AmpE [Nevskia sp.]|nr:regulatory signaling modulator protein AmpE [Nevskia sp.]
MKLLAMLLALAAERLFSPYRDAAVPHGVWTLLQKLLPLPAFWRSPAMPPLLVVLPAALIWFAERDSGSEPLRLPFDALLLFLCLGPRDLADDVQRLRSARSAGDTETVARLTNSLQMGPEPDADHRSLLGALFIQSHERLFGTLWWFLVGGPAGAVLYRLASRLPVLIEEPGAPAARSAALLHAVLAWIPARLTALLYALAGSMDDALADWRRLRQAPHADWQRQTWNVLATVTSAALDWEDGGGPVVASSLDAALAEVLRMQTRALLILLALTALFTAGSWIA